MKFKDIEINSYGSHSLDAQKLTEVLSTALVVSTVMGQG